jgi:cold shock CspA family protein
MRFEGKLEKWNDDRGFGFIAPARGGEPVFVHVSAFPRDGRRPQVGEALTFEVEPAGDGKKRAIRIERYGERSRPRPQATAPSGPRQRRTRTTGVGVPIGGIAIGIAIVLFAGNHFYGLLEGRRLGGASTSGAALPLLAAPPSTAAVFRCDGRTHCSEMNSCEEAKFFLKNCPDTKMDGDRDGIPCESQWCN